MRFRYEEIRERNVIEDSISISNTLLEKGFSWGGHKKSILWMYYPVARQNPFQSLLYRSSYSYGAGPLGLLQVEDAIDIPWGGDLVLHLHWLHGVTKDAKSKQEATYLVEKFRNTLEKLKNNHVRIVWTVHNALPHESKWKEEDIELRKIVVEMADAIHVMTLDTNNQVSPYFSLDEDKVFYVKHPAYEGVYPNYISNDEARYQLNVSDSEIALLYFGAIMKYKGYDTIIEHFDSMQNRIYDALGKKFKLIVAGIGVDENLCKKLKSWAQSRNDVFIRDRKISENEMQYLFNAADLVICPYAKALNSGVAMLGVTFGKPIVGPDIGAFKDNIPKELRYLYRAEDISSLIEQLVNAANDLKKNRPFQTDASLSPINISDDFFENAILKLNLKG